VIYPIKDSSYLYLASTTNTSGCHMRILSIYVKWIPKSVPYTERIPESALFEGKYSEASLSSMLRYKD